MEGGQTNEFRPLILVVEDDDSNFKLIEAIIRKKCDIQWAKNGEETVALLKECGSEAKAILIGIEMPVMSRLDATKTIRGENKEILITMQTAYVFSSDKENAVNTGASEVLMKSTTLSILRNTLTKHFSELIW